MPSTQGDTAQGTLPRARWPRHTQPHAMVPPALLPVSATFLIRHYSKSTLDRLFWNSDPSGAASSKQFISKFNSLPHFIAVRAICVRGGEDKKVSAMAKPVENNSGKTLFPYTAKLCTEVCASTRTCRISSITLILQNRWR